MAFGAMLLLLPTLLAFVSAQEEFFGESISFTSLQKNKDGTFEVNLCYRESRRGGCDNKPSFGCKSGACTHFENPVPVVTDLGRYGQETWCQSEGHATATIPQSQSLTLSDTGCCWAYNVNGMSEWTARGKVDLGYRSDTHTFNNCPITAAVASLRVPQNCFSSLRLLAYDPDGDHVQCGFAAKDGLNPDVSLDENECRVKANGLLAIGLHVFDLELEDLPTRDVNVSYADGTSSMRTAFNMFAGNSSLAFCQISLQFALEILPPLQSCVSGDVVPEFSSQTPSHGDALRAPVGDRFQLRVRARADHATIHDFQVSGPQNMTKELKEDKYGKAVTLSWTPALTDLHRVVPVCFTAETNQSQSEMRCVVVTVTGSSALEGQAIVTCSATQMTVALEKDSIPGVDKNWLTLDDPSCSLTSNETHIKATMSFNTCGTKLEDAGEFIVFKNEINSFEHSTAIITRRRHVKIGFSCQFPKTLSVSGNYQLHKSDFVFTESSFGSFGYTFEIFNDSSFTRKVGVDAYPVEVKLMDMIYMSIRGVSDLPDITLFVESCRATPDDDPDNSLFYDLIQNGCVKDETFKVHTSDPTSFNFEVQAFRFIGDFDQVYITCSVILCESGNPISRCAQGCLKDPKPSQRRKRTVSKETASHYISQGPLRLLRPAAAGSASDRRKTKVSSAESKIHEGIRSLLSSHTSTIVLGSLFAIVVAVLAGVIGFFVRKSKINGREELLLTEWES